MKAKAKIKGVAASHLPTAIQPVYNNTLKGLSVYLEVLGCR